MSLTNLGSDVLVQQKMQPCYTRRVLKLSVLGLGGCRSFLMEKFHKILMWAKHLFSLICSWKQWNHSGWDFLEKNYGKMLTMAMSPCNCFGKAASNWKQFCRKCWGRLCPGNVAPAWFGNVIFQVKAITGQQLSVRNIKTAWYSSTLERHYWFMCMYTR